MVTKECNVEKYTQQNCGKPIVCTDTHHCRSEMVLGITNNVSYCYNIIYPIKWQTCNQHRFLLWLQNGSIIYNHAGGQVVC